MELKFKLDTEQMQEICQKAVLDLGAVGFGGCGNCPHRDNVTGLCEKVLDTFGAECFMELDSQCIWFAPEVCRMRDQNGKDKVKY